MKPSTKGFLLGAAVGYWYRGRHDRKKAEASRARAAPPGVFAIGLAVVAGPFLVGILGAFIVGVFALVVNVIPGGLQLDPSSSLLWGYWVTTALMCLSLYVAAWHIGDLEHIAIPVRAALVVGLAFLHGLLLWRILSLDGADETTTTPAPATVPPAPPVADAGIMDAAPNALPATYTVAVTVAVDPTKPDGRAWDVAQGPPDVEGTILGLSGTLPIPLCRDSFACSATFPSLTLVPGLDVEITLFDRDVASNDSIGAGTLVWAGQPEVHARIGASTVTLAVTPLRQRASDGGVAHPVAAAGRKNVVLTLHISAGVTKPSGGPWDRPDSSPDAFWPDMSVALTVDAVPLTATCPFNTPSCDLFVANLALDPSGTAIGLDLVDRDESGSEAIGSGVLTWAGESQLEATLGAAVVRARFRVTGDALTDGIAVGAGIISRPAAGAAPCLAEPARLRVRVSVDRTAPDGSRWDEASPGDRAAPDPNGLIRIPGQPDLFIRPCRDSYSCRAEFEAVRVCTGSTITIFLTDSEDGADLQPIGSADWIWDGDAAQSGRVGAAEVSLELLSQDSQPPSGRRRRSEVEEVAVPSVDAP